MLAVAGPRQPYWVCGLYLVLLTVVALGAARFMDNLEHPTEVSHLRSILSERDTWVLALLYLGTFGSWIGFSFAFGLVLQVNFVAAGQSHGQAALHAAEFAFIGPALGSLARIYGGRLADRVGGSRVALAVFAAMGLATGAAGQPSAPSTTTTPGRTTDGHHGRLHRRLHGAVHPVRDRQRIRVQDDPVGLRGAQPPAQRRRSASAVTGRKPCPAR